MHLLVVGLCCLIMNINRSRLPCLTSERHRVSTAVFYEREASSFWDKSPDGHSPSSVGKDGNGGGVLDADDVVILELLLLFVIVVWDR